MSLQSLDGPDDPNRCQGVGKNGQCHYKAVQLPDGTYGTYCKMHGGHKQLESHNNKQIKIYNLGKWQARLEQQAEHCNVKSLRNEIGILRIALEERFSVIHSSTDLILHSGPISDLTMKIEKLVSSCHKLEGSMGQLLDKQAILNFASEVIGVISVALEGSSEKEVLMDKIGTGIMQLVGRIDETQA